RSDGLFGGLWEPPSIDGGPSAADDLSSRVPLVAPARRVGRVIHVLSHRRLTVDVHSGILSGWPDTVRLGDVYETVELFDEAAFDGLGISTLARKILAVAKGAGGGDRSSLGVVPKAGGAGRGGRSRQREGS
ncbi:MAG TPA: hypothetical protein VM580_35105, partial [Labilithrix sp.]|nr:hypothetical protein [Labilithrix sp.]